MKLILAQLETPNFSFMTVGNTQKRAHALMKQAWTIHALRTGATWTFTEIEDSIVYTEIQNDAMFIDNEPIHSLGYRTAIA